MRLEPEQAARHFQVIRGLVEAQIVDDAQELIGDARYRDVRDVDLFFAEEVQQEVERPREGVKLDDEPRFGAERGSGRSSGCRHSR